MRQLVARRAKRTENGKGKSRTEELPPTGERTWKNGWKRAPFKSMERGQKSGREKAKKEL